MNVNPRRISVAPMMDWTDRHCRMFHRQLSRHTWLYTEMVTTGALLHGDVPRHLDFDAAEHPVALQLGGSEPADLAMAAKLGQQWGYAEINLNCGCPSERVQRGAFGACLMAEPELVADSVKAMRDAVEIPVTVKHRIGIDKIEHYDFVRDFVGKVAQAGCGTFIVHARNAILKGLSPKENREIPPLRYEVAYQLKREFPELEILINGGIVSHDEIAAHLEHVDGVMIGREAYHQPYILAEMDARFYGDTSTPVPSRLDVELAMQRYIGAVVEQGGYMGAVTRHMLGLHRGIAGGRGWRRVLSDAKRMHAARTRAEVEALFEEARAHLRPHAQEPLAA
ncbi:tRNA dihydrouridine(20/20a) synthase DusA [Cupriavidus taiwanensis]|uniref:tRNA-dihydrouridine(20/20a) synthase n=1 Tax=Cupriavidus taiwanensis TaxID=164546 RepID=A0A375IFJ7_9BURK|nr:tRNA dihydrouridine(20/20a) synthase DusA [Cupriavidus taiwanensis]SOZ22004.1 tRNA-dihydrouridine synthase A [Cupriavidus taiwanensis]SPA26095.1 tRNA-dihydrouridine synthase A [Cupriavidus taiwanensis]SPK71975.1 tRNA-dihydrouridine synthase A [Cupriavidus taiwanensis]